MEIIFDKEIEIDLGVRGVVFVDTGVIIEYETLEKHELGLNYLNIRAKQLNEITSSNSYEVRNLEIGSYFDGYERKLIVKSGNRKSQ